MLIIVEPYTLTMTQTNVPADPTPAWSALGVYQFEEEVKHNDAIWSSSVDGDNQGNEPSATSASWVYKQAVNELAWGDVKISTKTVNADTIDMTFEKPPRMTYVGLVGIEAVSVTVEVIDTDGNVVFSDIQQTRKRTLYSWSDFWLAEYNQRYAAFAELPFTAPGATLRVLIDNTGTDAAVGVVAAGKAHYLATTKIDATSKIMDFSVDNTDKFGNVELLKRAASKLFTVNGIVDSGKYDYVLRTLSSLRSTLTLIVAERRLEAFTAYGKYDDFSLAFGEQTSALVLNGREII